MASPRASGNTVAFVSCNESAPITGIAIINRAGVRPAPRPFSALRSSTVVRKVYGLKPGCVHRVRNVRLGSFASVWPRTDDFRSTPINRQCYRASACLECARNGSGAPRAYGSLAQLWALVGSWRISVDRARRKVSLGHKREAACPTINDFAVCCANPPDPCSTGIAKT
jgi:hypothetical protein